jgi:hypothetical protein
MSLAAAAQLVMPVSFSRHTVCREALHCTNPPSEDDVIPVEHFDSRFIGIAYQDLFDRFLCAERHASRHSLIAKTL